MRITSSMILERATNELLRQRGEMGQTQSEVSSGRRVVTPSDDPVAAAAGERARLELMRNERDTRMVAFAKYRVAMGETTLGDLGDSLRNARDTLVQAGNGSLSDINRVQLAQQLRQSRNELMQLANRDDGAGGWIFGGQTTQGAPFQDGTPVTYVAQPGEQRTGVDAPAATTIDGRAVLTDIELPAGTSGTVANSSPNSGGVDTRVNIFTTLDDAIAMLEDASTSSAARADGLAKAVGGIDAAIAAQSVARTRLGEQLRAVDAFEARLADDKVADSARLAEMIDVDMVESLSRLARQQTQADAAMKTYAQISQINLFRYI